jgi:glutaredoxin-related protein
MTKHIIKRLRGYIGKSGRYVYECTCKNTVEAWNVLEARKIHRENLKIMHSMVEMNELLDKEQVSTKNRQVYYGGFLYK